MAWTNGDWMQSTGGARLTKLRALITEITNALQGDGVSSDGTRYDPANLSALLTALMSREAEISAALNSEVFLIPTRRADSHSRSSRGRAL